MQGEAKGDIRKAMKLAGYSDNTSTTEVIKPLADEIIEISKQILAGASVKAALTIDDTMDRPDRVGVQHALNAAKEALDRAGVIKKEQGNQVKADNVIFILPPKDSPVDTSDASDVE